ncbi:MAG: biotin carboxylase N-terminal domain-containing protein [Lachnospiraceae bacterium]|nr:biotin carboxylase N-terminal domain-containing protein [Lachnospiraceae bacterium]
MIKRILIANRGEIVNRIIRTCRKMGIETVVVYSDADAGQHYIDEADFSYNIGKSAPSKSYLNIDVLIDVLRESKADAVHPGYGFLSESADFAKAVAAEGAVWIGPAPEVLEAIESKCHCRKIASDNCVPITPGTIKPVTDINDIADEAHRNGLPLLLKLDKGGGGKGIHKIEDVDSIEKLSADLESVKAIGRMAFASDDVYVEKAVSNPRHIEVQFIADRYGNVICLGERECSIQRRFQKIIEESPSVAVSLHERKKLYQYTAAVVRAMGYSNAGTVEFLLDETGSFYFMEINARLQVEHPVSEMVTGIDIVAGQIKAASGEKLSMKQEDVTIEGHAIECRIYAEDPYTFVPCPGKIEHVVFPDSDNGNVRIEHAVYDGYKVSPFYDPMIAKVITKGRDRAECIERMKEALSGFVIEGIKTSIPFELKIIDNPLFKDGTFTTAFLDKITFQEDNV